MGIEALLRHSCSYAPPVRIHSAQLTTVDADRQWKTLNDMPTAKTWTFRVRIEHTIDLRELIYKGKRRC